MEKLDLTRPLRLQLDNFTDNMWGGDWIPRLKSLPVTGAPVGESWEFSAHPLHPSQVLTGARSNVRDLLAAHPVEILGPRPAARLNGEPPFLLKFIDSRDDLSVQVHPSDEYARARENDSGKAESWIILEADRTGDGGHIYLGFDPRRAEGFADNAAFAEAFLGAITQANAQGPSQDPAVRLKAERLVLPFLNRVAVRPGEVYDIPPGTVHAIGRGVRLYEIQQSSDLTYRVWDWNRPDTKKLKEGKLEFRGLHLDRARDVLDFEPRLPEFYRRKPEAFETVGGGAHSHWRLMKEAGGRFAAEKIRLGGADAWLNLPMEFSVLTVLRGTVEIDADEKSWGRVDAGASVLIPALASSIRLRCDGNAAELIRSTVPS